MHRHPVPEIEKYLISLSFSSITAAPPSTFCFPGKTQSRNAKLIWLRFTESWLNSISAVMEHLLDTKFTFPVTTQRGQYCEGPMEWNKDPEAHGRELGTTRQLLSKVPATGFPTQVPSDGREAGEGPVRPTFPWRLKHFVSKTDWGQTEMPQGTLHLWMQKVCSVCCRH